MEGEVPQKFCYLEHISRPRNYLIHTLLLLGLFGGLAVFFPETPLRANIANFFYIVVNLFITLLLLKTAHKLKYQQKDAAYTGWCFIAVAQGSVLTGDIIFSSIFLVQGENVYPSPADVFYILYFPLLFIGVLRMIKSREPKKISFLESALGVIILNTAVVFILVFLILPLLNEAKNDLIGFIVSMTYPIGDLIILFSLLYLLFQTNLKNHPLPVSFLSTGLLCLLIVDVLYGASAFMEQYQSGSLIDWLYLFSYSVVGYAAVLQLNSTDYNYPTEAEARNILLLIRVGISYLAILGQLFLLIAVKIIPEMENYFWLVFSILLITIVFGLIILEITSYENRKLLIEIQKANEQLEERIRQRTKELEESRKLLEQQANLDFLTGIPNRAFFVNQLKKEIISRKNKDEKFYLLLLDLDRFKDVNDTAGHQVGDELLIKVAQRLRSCVRESDLVARLGGDEFVVLITEPLDGQTMQVISNRIIERINEPFSIKTFTYKIGVSIGVVSSEFIPDVKSALQYADIAMYAAKNGGRNRIVYFEPHLLVQTDQTVR